MPWSAKAQSLVENQYASTGVAATHALISTLDTLQKAAVLHAGMEPLLESYSKRYQQVQQYIKSYQQYSWTVNSLDDYTLAPFHVLATNGSTWVAKDHEWHMRTIQHFCNADPSILLATPYKIVDLNDEASTAEATAWWLNLTGGGGEGMVVKPYQFIEKNRKGLIQPAIKVRGKEYLRIIYGPEYDTPSNMIRLKLRGLSAKRSLALREFSLGIEGLERFVNAEPLRRIHECAFGVLALESEPVDPAL